MKLDVPYYQQQSRFDCSSTALRMVLSFLDSDPGMEVLNREVGVEEGRAVPTISIAYAASSLGFETEFYTTDLGYSSEKEDMEFYQDLGGEYEEEIPDIVEEAREKGVEIHEGSLKLEELLEKVDTRSVPIVLVDWNVVEGKEGYQGHFVPVIGYDDEKVIVHCPEVGEDRPEIEIDREVFESVRKAEGTDEDIVVVHGDG